MKKDDFAERIFRDIYANVSPKEFKLRRKSVNVYKWESDYYDWRIIMGRRIAYLFASHRASRGLSMVRRYIYDGSKIMNESIRVTEGITITSCKGCMFYLGGGHCYINAELECREGGGFELYVKRRTSNEQSGTQSSGQSGTVRAGH